LFESFKKFVIEQITVCFGGCYLMFEMRLSLSFACLYQPRCFCWQLLYFSSSFSNICVSVEPVL